jgi:DNA-binding NarL/FixJ family response regulator
MNSISVLLVDDNYAFVHIAARFLRAHRGVRVAGSFSGGREALSGAQDLQPDVVLVDLAMPDFPGLEVIPRLREVLPGAGIIALTLLDADGYRQAALAAGADDFVSKATLGTDLLPAIWRVVQINHCQILS